MLFLISVELGHREREKKESVNSAALLTPTLGSDSRHMRHILSHQVHFQHFIVSRQHNVVLQNAQLLITLQPCYRLVPGPYSAQTACKLVLDTVKYNSSTKLLWLYFSEPQQKRIKLKEHR